MDKDIPTIMEAAEAMYGSLINMPCTCRREFLYHGKGVEMCRRCVALDLWEQVNRFERKTKKVFDTRKS